MNYLLIILLSFLLFAKEPSLRPTVDVPAKPVKSGEVDVSEYKDVQLPDQKANKELYCETLPGQIGMAKQPGLAVNRKIKMGEPGFDECMAQKAGPSDTSGLRIQNSNPADPRPEPLQPGVNRGH